MRAKRFLMAAKYKDSVKRVIVPLVSFRNSRGDFTLSWADFCLLQAYSVVNGAAF